jgi:hypothetical protein
MDIIDPDEALLQEAQDAAMEITDGTLLEDLVEAFKRKRHPGDFEVWPSDEQMEMFKRGER